MILRVSLSPSLSNRGERMDISAEVKKHLKEQFGVENIDLQFEEKGKGRIYAFRACNKFKAVSKGIYFATLEKDGLRLSIEGSFIAGRLATKNVVEVSREQALKWMRGENLEINAEGNYIILRYGNYFLGCGKHRKGEILNFVPKNRRIGDAEND